MVKQIKKQVVTVSKRFLHGHPRVGQETNFHTLIQNAIYPGFYEDDGMRRKRHTIRDNRPFWRSVFERGMLLSVRQWSGKPYQTPQETFLDLESGKWGVQEITMINGHNGLEAFVNEQSIDIDTLAANDGLSRADFEAWFAPHFKRKNVFYGMIIHFTDFRY